MRCSICLSEMKQGPNGLECVACGTLLEPVDDEGVPAFANSGVLSQNQRIGILAGVVAIIAAVLWGIFAFAPGQLSLNEATETVELADRSNDFILDDDNGIVGSVLDLSTRDGTNELILDKGCQRLFGDDPKTVRWVNLAGEPMAEIRPAFPGNWRLHQACPMPSSTTVFATLLSDGVAISQVDPNGALVWTQVVNASNPNADTTQVMMDDQSVLLVAHDMADGAVHLVSFDEDGGENWKQVIEVGAAINTVHTTKTSLGDILLAWQDPVTGLRMTIVSASGLVLQESVLDMRTQLLQGVVQDELGETLMLYGDRDTFVELISRSNDRAWQRPLDASAIPIGALSYETDFFVFGAINESLLVWGIDPFGAVSSPIEIQVAAPFQSSAIRQINAVEAILSLHLENASQMDLVIDLRRLRGALTYDVPDIADGADGTGGAEGTGIAASSDLADQFGLDENVLIETAPEPLDTLVTEADTNIAAPIENTVSASEQAAIDAPSPDPQTPSDEIDQNALGYALESLADNSPAPQRDGADQDAPATAPISQPAVTVPRARCTFTCVSSDEAAIEYVLMQSVDINDGETLTDVLLRLNDAHVDLCQLSGGEPAPEYTRECNPG